MEALDGRPAWLSDDIAFASARFAALTHAGTWPDRAEMGTLTAAVPEGLSQAGSKRRSEFLAGRLCAMAALETAGRAPRQPGRSRDGAPLWPAGTVGSIAHTAGLACAAVADAGRLAGLGLDLEHVCSDAEAAEIAPTVFASGEREALGRWPRGEAELVTLVFMAKEAFYKCIWPTVRRFVGFEEAAVSRLTEAEAIVAPRGRLALELARYRLQARIGRLEGCRVALCTMMPHSAAPEADRDAGRNSRIPA